MKRLDKKNINIPNEDDHFTSKVIYPRKGVLKTIDLHATKIGMSLSSYIHNMLEEEARKIKQLDKRK